MNWCGDRLRSIFNRCKDPNKSGFTGRGQYRFEDRDEERLPLLATCQRAVVQWLRNHTAGHADTLGELTLLWSDPHCKKQKWHRDSYCTDWLHFGPEDSGLSLLLNVEREPAIFWCVPGSHKLTDEAVYSCNLPLSRIEIPPGGAVCFNQMLMHSGGQNPLDTPHRRVFWYVNYGWVRAHVNGTHFPVTAVDKHLEVSTRELVEET